MTDSIDSPHNHSTADSDVCGCDDFKSSRRGFLGGVATLAGAGVLSAVHGTAFSQAAFAASGVSPGTIVVISLRGGADGMSMVVPHSETAYYTARQTIGVPADALLQKGTTFGLHPAFKPLEQMWIDKKFAAVHAVGLPQPNRSHFSAMEVIEDADPGSKDRIGWLNRLVGLSGGISPFEAVNVGDCIVPTELFGPAPSLAVRRITDLTLAGPTEVEAHKQRIASLQASFKPDQGPLGNGARSAVEVSEAYGKLPPPGGPRNGAVYPNSDLGDALADGANLLRDNLGVEVLTVDSGSWDLHAGIGTLDYGAMKGLISDLALSIAAFFKDLGPTLADTVTVVTISEFGRRLQENAAKGLDHGYGNCMLLLGAGVNGGDVYGEWPGLNSQDLTEGDLKMTRDYRSVLADVVKARFNPDMSKVFPGFTPEPIGAMRAA